MNGPSQGGPTGPASDPLQPAPPTAMARRHCLHDDALAGLQRVLDRALPGMGATCGARGLRRAARMVGSFVGDTADWSTLLAEVAGQLGVGSNAVHRSCRDAIQTAIARAPLVTALRGDDGALRWVVLLSHRRGRARACVATGSHIRRAEVDAAALADCIGAESTQSPLLWLVLEPTLPLEPLRVGRPCEKPDRSLTPLGRVLGALRLERETLWIVGIYAAVAGLLTLATPLAVQALVNTIAFGTLVQPLVVLTIMLLAGLAFAGALRVMQSVLVETLQRRLFVRTVADLAARLPRVQTRVRDTSYGPELVNRFFDVVTLQKASASLLLDGLDLALATLIGILVLTFYHPLLFAFSAILGLAITAVVFLGGRGAVRTAIEESERKFAIAAWLEELARVPLPFKSRRGAALAVERADELAHAYLDARQSHFKRVLRQIFGFVSLQVLASTALLGLGGWLVINRQLTLGQLVAAELVVTVVVVSLAKFGKQLETFYDLTAAVDKLGKLIDLPLERVTGEPLPQDPGPASVRIRGVSLAGATGPLLETLDLDVSPGERLGLTGSNPGGASCLLELLCGLREPARGHIEIAGKPLQALDLGHLREHVLLLRQTMVVAATIEQNLRLYDARVGAERLQHCLHKVGLQEDIQRLALGLETPLSAEGYPLTASQLTRLTLAAALAVAPRLLLIDGLLDGIEPELLPLLMDTLCDREAPWTLIVASYQPAVLERCDRIASVVMGDLNEPLGERS